MSKQRMFFMIKPDGIEMEYKIMSMVQSIAKVVKSKSFDKADMQKIEKLYEMHKEAFFYSRLLDFFKKKPMKVFLLEEKDNYQYNKNFIEDFVELVGDTDPAKAQPGTIRSLSSDSLEKSIDQKRALRNLVHRSRTFEEAEKEAKIFFDTQFTD